MAWPPLPPARRRTAPPAVVWTARCAPPTPPPAMPPLRAAAAPAAAAGCLLTAAGAACTLHATIRHAAHCARLSVAAGFRLATDRAARLAAPHPAAGFAAAGCQAAA